MTVGIERRAEGREHSSNDLQSSLLSPHSTIIKASETCPEMGWEMAKNPRWKLEHLALLLVPPRTETIPQASPPNL